MSNTIPSDLQVNAILTSALTAFKRILLPILAFSTKIENVPLQGTNKVAVPFYPLDTTASSDYDPAVGYTTAAGVINGVDVTINKRKFQGLSATGYELARQPILDLEKLGKQKAEKLAYDVVLDILSNITIANFGAALETVSASAFDYDHVVDLATALTNTNWSPEGRSLILNATYQGALLKDTAISNGINFGEYGIEAKLNGGIARVAGFDLHTTPNIPGNSINLVGFAVKPQAMLVGFSPIAPATPKTTRYMVATDPDTNLTLEYREFEQPGLDTLVRVIECNYGAAVADANACKLLVSA